MSALVVIEVDALRALMREEFAALLASQNGDDLISAVEAAKILDVSARTVNTYAKQGQLKNYSVGKHLKLKRREVVEFKQRKVGYGV